MAGINQVTLVGRIAVDRPVADGNGERQAGFINVVAWNKTAEMTAKYLGKGRLAGIVGRLQVRSWETPSGQRRWTTEVVAQTVQFLDMKPEGQDSGDAGLPSDVDVPPARDEEEEEVPF